MEGGDGGCSLHRMRLPESVELGECWGRDGLQNEPDVVPTERKVEVLAGLAEAGFRVIEATSFAHPKYLPQFADAEAVLERLPRRPGLRYRGLCANLPGVDRAIRSRQAGYGVDEIALILATTDAYNLVNVKMTREQNKRLLDRMAKAVLASGHTLFGWVVTSFGCPITGDVPLREVAAVAKWWKSLGARYVGFGDTTGSSNPRQVSDFVEFIQAEGFTADEIVLHFHDTRGWGIANCLTALTYGIRRFDCSLGGIGGQARTGAAEYHQGYGGNTCTEDLAGLLEEMGVRTGVDLPTLLHLGHRSEEILGRKLRSNFLEAGPVPHRGIVYDPERGILRVKG